MNFLQHLECFFLGGKPTFIFTKGIDITAPVYYRQIPEAEDYSTKLTPVNKVKYYDVPELPLEFVPDVPKDEEDKKKLFLIKAKTSLDKLFSYIPYNHRNLGPGEDKRIFDEYLQETFSKAGLATPSFDESLFEPQYCIRNGILYSFLKRETGNRYTIDFTHYHKYKFRKEINPPILKAKLKLEKDILVFESISRFDKELNLIETVPADGSKEFIRIRSDLYATAFFDLTAVQHLLGCHFLAGFNLNVGVRMLSNENPLKQFLWNFVYGTMNINSQIDTLIGKKVGSVIALSPFQEDSFYEFLRDSAQRDFSELFSSNPAIPNEMSVDLKNIKSAIEGNLGFVLEHSKQKFKSENDRMFEFLRGKIKELKDRTDQELLASLVYAVSAHHEIVGNNSLELRSQSVLSTYNISKYEYIASMLVLIITAIPIRKITAHDVESTIKDDFAKSMYLNMVSELLDYETTMKYTDHRNLRIKPSNLEAAVQV
jgi:hypothetical protein